jgi:hypothetical protein
MSKLYILKNNQKSTPIRKENYNWHRAFIVLTTLVIIEHLLYFWIKNA